MSRIAISEDDLDGDSGAPVVYGPVGGPPHPNVYGPVPPTTHPGPVGGELAVATWVLVVAAVVLCVTFGAGGFFAGRAGHISKADQRAERQAERARLETQLTSAVRDAKAATRTAERSRAAGLIASARKSGYRSGRVDGLAAGREQSRNELESSYTDTCLTPLGC